MTSSRLGASIVADLRSPLMARAVYVNVGIRPLWDFGGAIGHTSPVSVVAHCGDDDSREERLRRPSGNFSHHFRADGCVTLRERTAPFKNIDADAEDREAE